MFAVGKGGLGVEQELENQNRQLATCEAAINPQDYITRAEAARATASRLAARDEEHAAELSRRIAAVERDAAWKLESREVELIGQSTAKMRQVGPQCFWLLCHCLSGRGVLC